MSDIVTLNGYKIKDEKAVRSYESIAQMKADTKLKEGYHVKTKGYYEVNDGGNGEYIIVDDDTLVDDGGLIHVLSNGLRAKLINSKINVKQFGAYGDGTHDDTTSFKNALSLNREIYIPNGNYLLTDNLTVNSSIYGEHKYNTHLIFSGLTQDTYAITVGIGYVKLNNFRITSIDETQSVGTTINYNGINISDRLYINLKDLYIEGFNLGLNLGNNCWNNVFESLYIYSCNKGIYLGSECNDDTFNDCLIKKCKIGFHKIAGATVNINGCDFSYNEKGIVLENHGDLNITGTYFELNTTNSISCTWGMSAFESIVVKDCSFTENNATTKIFYFNGGADSKAVIQNCFFRNVGETNITMCQYQTSQFKPIFIDNRYNNTFIIDTTRAEYIKSKVYTITYLTTDSLSFTSSGIGFKTYTEPTTPTGTTLLSKEFIRTDSGSYNLIVDCPINKNYIVYNSTESINVTGYVKCTYINI